MKWYAHEQGTAEKGASPRSIPNDRKMALKFQLPIAVFLDTNILDGLPETLQSGELTSLVSDAQHVLVADIVAREWVTHRIKKAATSLEDAGKACTHIAQYDKTWVTVDDRHRYELERKVTRTSVRRLRAANIRVTQPPVLNSRALARRASRGVPPFAERGRGFKDELILLGMLKYLRIRDFRSVVLVSKDADFSPDVGKRFAKIDVAFALARTIKEASELVRSNLNESVQQVLRQKASAAEKLVIERIEEIKETLRRRMQAAGVSELYLYGMDAKTEDIPPGATATRLISVQPRRLAGVTVGASHPTSGRSLLTVLVECELTLELSIYDAPPIGRITTQGRQPVLPGYQPRLSIRTIKRDLLIEATAKESDDGGWTDLQIMEDSEFVQFVRDINVSLREAEIGAPTTPSAAGTAAASIDA